MSCLLQVANNFDTDLKACVKVLKVNLNSNSNNYINFNNQ